MGIFNRKPDKNRQSRANELANFLNVKETPKIASTLPFSNSQFAWFFLYAYERNDQDIDSLWELFEKAMIYAASGNEDTRTTFVQAYDKAMQCEGIQWKLTVGLYWIRPQSFIALNGVSKPYIKKALNIAIPTEPYSGQGYLNIIDSLKKRFEDTTVSPNSFPELYREAKKFKDTGPKKEPPDPPEPDDTGNNGTTGEHIPRPYTVDEILADGCFMERKQLAHILKRWEDIHNLILQGPPGTGKTWLAKRLAYALIGEKDPRRVRSVQFHPNLSYEDFVRGWRPDEDGRLVLMDGPFVQAMGVASKNPDKKYVIVIEEVNRGEPAKIFGELLTLLESDKRTPEEALELTYRHPYIGPEYIPDNLYVIGTMNIADRSLALVDLALRRRFDFVDLEPTFNTSWQEWVQAKYEESDYEIDAKTIDKIGQRIKELNENIEADSSLGKQFRIGHSYVTPPKTPTTDVREWFLSVVDYKIGPLLEEYWFDNLEKAAEAKKKLKDF